ncbi:hypothetical protein B0H11DRAFT_862750 [Mycena galericulata]|nr:hypothetical protein B0H11DRAFT_862750 [Mycena galericulata]
MFFFFGATGFILAHASAFPPHSIPTHPESRLQSRVVVFAGTTIASQAFNSSGSTLAPSLLEKEVAITAIKFPLPNATTTTKRTRARRPHIATAQRLSQSSDASFPPHGPSLRRRNREDG